ncbi:hypothetical protein Tcan_08266 [Toxocara canis]|uniref:Uncharacterized protein n=1 Tax=Toxocara canis TaxID=6265 RepID=A0A0B2V6A3_TOXCA|nr:hypothetical protein Tcan_08266 [Toxocara canis]
MVRTLTHSLDSILKSNSERLQTMKRDTSSDAEEQRRRRSATFIGIAESCDLPHLRHVRDVESVAEILDELNVDESCDPPHLRYERDMESVAQRLDELNVEGVLVEMYRTGVFNPSKRRPVKHGHENYDERFVN